MVFLAMDITGGVSVMPYAPVTLRRGNEPGTEEGEEDRWGGNGNRVSGEGRDLKHTPSDCQALSLLLQLQLC